MKEGSTFTATGVIAVSSSGLLDLMSRNVSSGIDFSRQHSFLFPILDLWQKIYSRVPWEIVGSCPLYLVSPSDRILLCAYFRRMWAIVTAYIGFASFWMVHGEDFA